MVTFGLRAGPARPPDRPARVRPRRAAAIEIAAQLVRARRLWPAGRRWCRPRRQQATAAPSRATAGRRASTSPAHAVRRAPRGAGSRTNTARRRVASSSASCSGVVSRMSGGSALLALAFRRRRVAGTRLQPDRQLHLAHRHLQVAGDVDCERLQRRDVERVQAAFASNAADRWRSAFSSAARVFSPSLHQASAKSPPVFCRRRSARSAMTERSALAFAQQFELVRARRQPRLSNQRAKASGSSSGVSMRSRQTSNICSRLN